jgi:hypothetical protein
MSVASTCFIHPYVYRLVNQTLLQDDTLLSGRIRRSPCAGGGNMRSCVLRWQGEEEADTLPTSFLQEGTNPGKFGLERETGLESATPCLEGRRAFSGPEATAPG